MHDSEDFYQKYLSQLTKQIPPYNYNKVTIIASLFDTNYQNLFKRYRKSAQKQFRTIPILYQIQENIIFIDCGKYFLPISSKYTKAALLNLLYLYGQIKNINILFFIPFNNDKQQIKFMVNQITNEIVYSFGQQFLNQNFQHQRQKILKSISFLFYNIIGNQKQRMIQNVLKNLKQQQTEKFSSILLDEVLQKNKIYYFYEKEGLKINTLKNIYQLQGQQFIQQGRKYFFIQNMKKQKSKQGQRLKNFQKSLNEVCKNFQDYCSLLQNNLQDLLEPDKRQNCLQKCQKSFNFNYKNIFSLKNRTKQQKNPIVILINLTLQIFKLKEKGKKQIQNHIKDGTKLNNLNIFYQLIKLLCQYKIIINYGFLQQCKIFQAISFIKMFSHTFPYITIDCKIQVKIQQMLPIILQILINKILQVLENQKISQDLVRILKLINILSKKLQNLQKQENGKLQKDRQFEDLFSGGKKIKQRIKVIEVQNSFLYFKKINNLVRIKQKLQWAVKCQLLIRQLDQYYLHNKSKMLKKIYKSIAQQFKIKNKFYYSFKLFQASQSFYSFVNVFKKWVNNIQKQNLHFDVKQFLNICQFIYKLGLISQAKQILYQSLSFNIKQTQYRQICQTIYQISQKSSQNQQHQNFLENLSYQKICLIDKKQIQGVQELVEQICFE